MRIRAAAARGRSERNHKGRSISGCPEGEIASDLSAARNFINKIERSGEGFFYI